MKSAPIASASIPAAVAKSGSALPGLCLAMLMASLDTSIAHTALPVVAQAFDASFAQARWVILAYLLAVTALSAVAGRLGDAFGRRRLLLAGMALFTVASALCAAAPSLSALVAARALQGAGAAVMMALSVALVGDVMPGPGRGRAMGMLGTMSAIGTTLGPLGGSMLAGAVGWPAIFIVNVPLGVAGIMLVRSRVPEDGPRQRSAANGMRALLGDATVRACLAMTWLVSMVMLATLLVGPFYLARTLTLGPAAVGLALSAGPLAAALSGVPAGMLTDRFGARAMVRVGLAGMAAGCTALALLGGSLAWYLGPLLLVTASYALFQAANAVLMVASAAPAQRGAASGLLGLARNLGFFAGTWVIGAVFAAGWATGDAMAASASQVAAGMHRAFALAALLMLAAFVLSAFTRRQ